MNRICHQRRNQYPVDPVILPKSLDPLRQDHGMNKTLHALHLRLPVEQEVALCLQLSPTKSQSRPSRNRRSLMQAVIVGCWSFD